jgi:hypothetical protein
VLTGWTLSVCGVPPRACARAAVAESDTQMASSAVEQNFVIARRFYIPRRAKRAKKILAVIRRAKRANEILAVMRRPKRANEILAVMWRFARQARHFGGTIRPISQGG